MGNRRTRLFAGRGSKAAFQLRRPISWGRSLLSPMSAYGTKLPQVERGIDQVEVVLGWAVLTVVDS